MSSLKITSVRGPNDEPLVQMILVTINGTQHALVGPVVYLPGVLKQDVTISDVEFGEIMPAYAAARMLEGGFRESLGLQVQ